MPCDLPKVAVGPDSLAYIFYTSGSTGKPKGVFDNHRNVLHNVLRYTNTLHISSTDRLSLLQSCSFSGTVSSLFSAVLNGGTICPFNIRGMGPSDLAEWINQQEITIYHSVPAILRSFLEGDRHFLTVRLVRLEGDRASKIDFELFRKYFSPACILVNGLGTTETGIASQFFMDRESVVESAQLPIGDPTPDMNILLLDDDGQPAAHGAVGEIVVRSDFLALGYWKNPELTRKAFVSSISEGGRRYRTGDLGRFGPDGSLEYLGRSDFKIKVRGQTVEADEIESALSSLAAVKNALVVACKDPRGQDQLVAYIIFSGAARATVTEIRCHLLELLPVFMVPSHFVFLDEFPLTSHNKVDRRCLPQPDWSNPDPERPHVPPHSLLESQLLQIWEEVLGVSSIGVTDDFFELGGHSLLAARMLEQIEAMFGKRIPPSFLLGGATVRQVAEALARESSDLRLPWIEIRRGHVSPPFCFVHGDYRSGGFYSLNLSRFLNADEPFYALPPQHTEVSTFPRTFEAMSAAYVDALQQFRPEGPYFLGGVCNGGHVAFEMARFLEARGQQVPLLMMVRSTAKNIEHVRMWRALNSLGMFSSGNGEWQQKWFQRWQWFVHHLEKRPLHEQPKFVLEQVSRLAGHLSSESSRSSSKKFALSRFTSNSDLYGPYRYLEDTFVPKKYPGRITLFWPEDDEEKPEDAAACWSKVAREVELHVLPGDHITCITKHAAVLAQKLQTCLTKAREGLRGTQ
jgi:thioesterase domain-containing protein/acyl carrier protein